MTLAMITNTLMIHIEWIVATCIDYTDNSNTPLDLNRVPWREVTSLLNVEQEATYPREIHIAHTNTVPRLSEDGL